MPIVASDIHLRLSGGSGNSDPNAALGGVKSSVSIVHATAHNLFDMGTAAELAAGDVEYRCFYIHNNHGTLTAQNSKIWISSNTPSADTTYDIGLGTAAINATEQTVANESTAPSGVTFSAAANEGAALSIGNIAPGEHKAVWVRRTINAAAAAFTDDPAEFSYKYETFG